AAAIRALGFAPISADGNQGDLVALISEHFQPGAPLLYFAGHDRTGDLAAALAVKGLHVHTVVAYRAVAVEALAEDAAQAFANGRMDGVLHYSRRSGAALVQAASASEVSMVSIVKARHFCLAEPVAEPLREAGATRVMIAPRPEEEALFDLIPKA